MLYDPKWEKTTKADPYALTSLISWMEGFQPTETYCYADNGVCLIARYLHHVLGFEVKTGFETWNAVDGQNGDIPDRWVWEIAYPTPHTFGAALARARAFLAS